jgi:hypothetical protein
MILFNIDRFAHDEFHSSEPRVALLTIFQVYKYILCAFVSTKQFVTLGLLFR